jgi:lipoprotein-releasing system permease protein
MLMSLAGIVFGVAFFVITQAQTSGFEKFFIRTILGTNGAILVSNAFDSEDPSVSHILYDSKGHVLDSQFFENRRRTGVSDPVAVRSAILDFDEINGISEIYEGRGYLESARNGKSVEVHGIDWFDHSQVSELSNQIIFGSIGDFVEDADTILLGSRVAEALHAKVGDRVNLSGGGRGFAYKVCAIFESGVSDIDKNRVYLSLSDAKSFLGTKQGGSYFQLSVDHPDEAADLARQMQHSLRHRVVSWQEREQVWLDVFKALRFSSAITVSTILLLSGLGMFNTFAIMVIEKTRDIAILRALGFSPTDISAVFIWQGLILLFFGTLLGAIFGALLTLGISQLPLRIRGIFSSDHFVVNWDPWHYVWAIMISTIVVLIACSIPARRASKIEPAKIIRETL